MEKNGRAGRQKLADFKVIFDSFIFCFYFIQQQKYNLYYVTYVYFWNSEEKSILVLLQLKIQSTRRFQPLRHIGQMIILKSFSRLRAKITVKLVLTGHS